MRIRVIVCAALRNWCSRTGLHLDRRGTAARGWASLRQEVREGNRGEDAYANDEEGVAVALGHDLVVQLLEQWDESAGIRGSAAALPLGLADPQWIRSRGIDMPATS